MTFAEEYAKEEAETEKKNRKIGFRVLKKKIVSYRGFFNSAGETLKNVITYQYFDKDTDSWKPFPVEKDYTYIY